jgi:hypothetical protein
MARSNVQQGPMAVQTRKPATRTAPPKKAEPPKPAPMPALRVAEVIDVEAVPAPAPKPAPPVKRSWVFFHGASPAFRWLLPKDLRGRTQMGYVDFRPDYAGRKRNDDPIRGKYVTDDADVARAIREAIAAKRLRGIWEDDSHLMNRCAYCDFTTANNEQGRREMAAHVQVEHDRI